MLGVVPAAALAIGAIVLLLCVATPPLTGRWPSPMPA
jgi:hypothetical protein